jgi:hypothetical protein
VSWRRIWSDPVWSKVIATVILAAAGALLAATPRSPLALAVLTVVVVLGAALLTWAFLRSSITWKFDTFLGMVGGGGDLRIISFQATGFNRSRRGLRSVAGHLISNIDNSISDQLQFVIGGTPVPPSATTGIPPAATFQIMVPLCDFAKGSEAYLTEFAFRRKWNSFRFVADFDGYHYEREFSQRRVSRVIEAFRRVANPPPKPEVRKRDSGAV